MLHPFFFMGNTMAEIITIDEYKAFASIEGKKNDPQIAALIKSCSEIVQEFIGYPLTATGDIEATVRTRAHTTEYMLPNFEMDVSDVKYIPRGDDASSGISLDKHDYYVADTGKLELYSLVPNNGDSILISYSIAAPDLESIKLATMLLVKYYYKEEFNKTSVGAGGQTVSYQTGKNFPPHVRAILMMHRMF
ncbi:hypothetical protein KNV09_gp025 [Vibrio phage Athena]|uniref:Head completion protein n=2 Tax=Thalassavirus TaxID=2948922 RepID=A0A6M9Z6C2_9CAUD|nr:hypothetical protein KNV09_gp025 [Vibrio phage Athena]QKN85669.1 hypothetical protein ATHENA_25 [Vibrio phage Athena]